MEQPALTILNAHRIMAVSTVRPDGWPQTTIVGYANAGFDIYFLIFRSSQKFANIQHEPRISIAVGEEPRELGELQAVYAGAIASEVTDPAERETAWQLLTGRHPNLAGFESPNPAETALIRAQCRHISVLDFTQGRGHTETLTIGDSGTPVRSAAGESGWGSSDSTKTV
jgi:nitroimidazol reductase NimA-like FMN-containing flavoprotein (pyridoxamine 5'-phosphate oxidase superfamily)